MGPNGFRVPWSRVEGLGFGVPWFRAVWGVGWGPNIVNPEKPAYLEAFLV